MNNTKIIITSLILFLILLFMLFFAFPKADDNKFISPSVTTFAYDTQRTGSTISSVYGQQKMQLSVAHLTSLEHIDNETHFMPLYLNGKEKQLKEYLLNKRVLIIPSNDSLVSISIDDDQILWRQPLNNSKIVSTPVINKNKRLIYFLSVMKEGQNYQHYINQVDLLGENYKSYKVPINDIFNNRYPKRKNDDWSKRLNCKTALGLNDRINPPYIYFGCSMTLERSTKDSLRKYGAMRGISGLIISIPLQKNGDLVAGTPDKVFFSSQITNNDMTGYDTGIFNFGSAPTMLLDGSLIISTGNGPVDLKDKNFGCSVVRISGETFEPLTHPDGTTMAFSHSLPPYNECWYTNIEYTSSSAPTVSYKDSYISAILTKDGYLDIFNPDQMFPQRNGITRKKISSLPTYGQPSMYQSKNKVFLYTYAQVLEEREFEEDKLLYNDSQFRNEQIKEARCLGWVSKKESGSELELLYSGPIRDEYAVSIKNSSLDRHLKSFFSEKLGVKNHVRHIDGHWAPYIKIKSLGYSLNSQKKYPLDKTKLTKLDDLTRFFSVKNFENPKIMLDKNFKQEPFYYLKDQSDAKRCRNFENKDLKPLYVLRRKVNSATSKGDALKAFSYQPETKELKKEWIFKLKEYELLLRSHAAISTNREYKRPVVIALTQKTNTKDQKNSRIYLLDAQSGQELAKAAFEGFVHYAMPLVVDDMIFISTLESGIHAFKVSY